MNLNQLKLKLAKIKKLGFVQTHRTGNTGIGKTLEDLLGIKENNIPLHDISGVAELKAYRKEAKSMLTLFTLEPLPAGGDRDKNLLDNFGYSKRDNGRSKELHSTLSCKRYNNQSLKLPALVYVLASNRIIRDKEFFNFDEAYFLTDFDFDSFKKMVKKDYVVVDFRMFYKPNGQVRNHGTGFRVKINKLDDCFKKKVRLV